MLAPRTVINQCELIRQPGSGGLGAVYSARDQKFGRAGSKSAKKRGWPRTKPSQPVDEQKERVHFLVSRVGAIVKELK